MYWKLNHPYLKDWLYSMKHVHGAPLPPPAVAFKVAKRNYRTMLEGYPRVWRRIYMFLFNARYWGKGKTFGIYPRRPGVAVWEKGWCHKELARPGR